MARLFRCHNGGVIPRGLECVSPVCLIPPFRRLCPRNNKTALLFFERVLFPSVPMNGTSSVLVASYLIALRWRLAQFELYCEVRLRLQVRSGSPLAFAKLARLADLLIV